MTNRVVDGKDGKIRASGGNAGAGARTKEASSMTTIPNFRAQGLIIRDHDLGAAMSQSPRPARDLRRS